MIWARTEFNDYNGTLFNIRTRALNNLVYWLSQIVGSVAIGFLLDQQGIRRRVRALSGWCVLFVMVFVVHIWMYFYQRCVPPSPCRDFAKQVTLMGNREYTRGFVASPDFHTMDFTDSKYPSRVWLYIFCGLLDAMWQTTAYWFMGAMSNNPSKLAHFAGFCKSSNIGHQTSICY